jgi:hypothetical protein
LAQVKAERHVDGTHTIEDLQQKTVHHIKSEYHEEEEMSTAQDQNDLKQGKANPVH